MPMKLMLNFEQINKKKMKSRPTSANPYSTISAMFSWEKKYFYLTFNGKIDAVGRKIQGQMYKRLELSKIQSEFKEYH